jgi:hypothetical protein
VIASESLEMVDDVMRVPSVLQHTPQPAEAAVPPAKIGARVLDGAMEEGLAYCNGEIAADEPEKHVCRSTGHQFLVTKKASTLRRVTTL